MVNGAGIIKRQFVPIKGGVRSVIVAANTGHN